MRVTQELLYDSEATLRLVDRVLEDLDIADQFCPTVGTVACRTEQLREQPAEAGDPSTRFVQAYWEIQDALELVRDSHAALQPVAVAGTQPGTDEHDLLNRALAMLDQLQSEEQDRMREATHDGLRGELLALAERLNCRDTMADRLNLTADLLSDLELRLNQLAKVFDTPRHGLWM